MKLALDLAEILGDDYAEYFPEAQPATTTEEARAGRPIKWPKGMKGHTHRNWTHARTDYCYTPHADVNGNYWAFNIVWTTTKDGRSGKRTNEVRCAKRSVAKRKAYKRYADAAGIRKQNRIAP